MHHGQNLQCFLRQTLSLRKHCNSWPRSLKSTVVQRVFMLINLTSLRENLHFAYVKTKTQISCAVTAQLISVSGFATRIVQFFYFLYTIFQTSNHLLGCTAWFVSEPPRPFFSQRGSFRNFTTDFCLFLQYV